MTMVHLNILSSYPMQSLRTGMQVQVPETGRVPKQDTGTTSLNPDVGIPKGLKGRVVPSPYTAKLGLMVSTATSPGGPLPASSVPV